MHKASPGYYSIIQYCPSASRGEAANIGVAIFCPEPYYMGVRMCADNARIFRFFGEEGRDAAYIDMEKQGLVNRLCHSEERITSLPEWNMFIQTRANAIQMSPPRGLIVRDPQADLDALYQELVAEGGRK